MPPAMKHRPRRYPAHVYRVRRAAIVKSWCALLALAAMTTLSLVAGMPGGWLFGPLTVVMAALTVSMSASGRTYVCVDRDGVEIASLYRMRRVDWPDLDGTSLRWRTWGKSIALHCRSQSAPVLIADVYDAPPDTIAEHIDRYRLRYGRPTVASEDPTGNPADHSTDTPTDTPTDDATDDEARHPASTSPSSRPSAS